MPPKKIKGIALRSKHLKKAKIESRAEDEEAHSENNAQDEDFFEEEDINSVSQSAAITLNSVESVVNDDEDVDEDVDEDAETTTSSGFKFRGCCCGDYNCSRHI